MTGTKTPKANANSTREGQQTTRFMTQPLHVWALPTQTPASWLQAIRFYVISVSRNATPPGKELDNGRAALAQGLDVALSLYRTAAQWTTRAK